MQALFLTHPFPPVFNADSRVLILGSFPSAASRGQGFYYGHPRNRFWRVIAAVTGEELPADIPGKKALLLRHGIALWDSVASCSIAGSSDASIRNAEPNDIAGLLAGSGIERIFCNGTRSWEIYMKYQYPLTGIKAAKLPSTSPANAAWSLERLIEVWRVIGEGK